MTSCGPIEDLRVPRRRSDEFYPALLPGKEGPRGFSGTSHPPLVRARGVNEKDPARNRGHLPGLRSRGGGVGPLILRGCLDEALPGPGPLLAGDLLTSHRLSPLSRGGAPLHLHRRPAGEDRTGGEKVDQEHRGLLLGGEPYLRALSHPEVSRFTLRFL